MRNLSVQQAKLVSCLELQADMPVQGAAKLLRTQTHRIHYHLKRLRELGLISEKRPIVDMQAIGYTYYTLYFSLSAKSQSQKNALIAFLDKSALTTWIFELGAEYQYGVSICVRHISEVNSFMEELGDRFGDIFFRKSLSAQMKFSYFGRRYLTQQRLKTPTVQFIAAPSSKALDSTDISILDAMANADCTTLNQISRTLGIPIATIDRRKHRLEQQGIIRGYFFWVNMQLLGYQAYVIMISIRGLTPVCKESLYEFANKETASLYYIECLGEWDFELGVEVKTSREITSITERLFDRFREDIESVKVTPILNYLKFKSFPRISASELSN